MTKKVLCAACHPDDIEFMMAGTAILLKEKGYEIHYLNVANGSCGTAVHDKEEIVQIRTKEAQDACNKIGAIFHYPVCGDLEVYYDRFLVSKLCAIVRQIDPEILLLQSPQDYMEDHTNTVRLMVTAAFCRNMKNMPTDPNVPPVSTEMAVYHAMPYGLKDQLRNILISNFYVNIESVITKKREMLACHRSQKEWLDHSQGLDSYLKTMEDMSADVGKMSKKFKFAEGWRRHSHLGFGSESFDPLCDVLKEYVSS
jgi:LmbE family N-acetylglucosaminyl deacetylase